MTDTALVEVRGLTKHFTTSGGVTRAVDGLDFRISRGETVGLLGESGSGKTTTGRLLLRLTPPSGGEIRFNGADVASLRGAALKTFRTQAQLVFQNPFDALNPRFTMRQSLAEPLINAGVAKAEREDRMQAVLRQVHLPDAASVLATFPHQMSGGQLQRVVLARALILEPDFIVADEPVSMLDVSVRAGILNLMRDVRDAMGLAAIYISHDVTLVRYVCARTLVMYRGRIIEDGPTADVVRRPRHPYTQALISAVPVPRAQQNRAPILLRHNRGGSLDLAVGCGFRDRCPHAFDRCVVEKPALRPVASAHLTACHLDL
ncbi:oligopeptide/dipeptide ABC transporter ATP-binding protein [Rhodopila sp.]|uniref:oligopeptide/dipeptide ABC transporter ATP-binding protein n=1 Tax=Rhodopila sp. TaxID=2480087 RepID=UPI003D0CF57C